jgi:septum formation protein
VRFSVIVPEIEELLEGSPEVLTTENAKRKAQAVATSSGGAVVLGVDTVVCLDDRIYGKPADADEARLTLEALSGRRHTVIGGICVIADAGVKTAAASTVVEFRTLGDELVEWYLACGEWRERAGGYAIQGRGAALVAGIEGDYLNVVGLPVAKLLELAPWLPAG